MRPFDLFFNFQHGKTDGPTDISSYRDAILQCRIYISVMFLGLPDNIQEEKPSLVNFENNWLPTDGRMDGRTDRRTNGPTDPLIEMRERI